MTTPTPNKTMLPAAGDVTYEQYKDAGWTDQQMIDGGLLMSPSSSTEVGGIAGAAGDRLRSFVERIERLEEEKEALGADVREVYSEAKGTGFDVKILREIIRLRKMDVSDRQEQEEILDIYKRALGM